MMTGTPLFQGNSTKSMLQEIFEITGIPTQDDLDFLGNKEAIKLASDVQIKKKRSWRKILSTDDEDLLQLLD